MDLPITQHINPDSLGHRCPNHNCVWGEVEQAFEDVRVPGATEHERKVALMFLVHFVGDMHQPLHDGDDGDRGGNAVQVTLDGVKRNLHSVWDGLVSHGGDGMPTFEEMLSRVNAEIDRDNTSSWITGNMATAATMEGWEISRDQIYPDVRKAHGQLGKDYMRRMQRVVDGQLARAGVRLAAYLNQAFGAPALLVKAVDTAAVGKSIEKAIALSPVN